MILEKIGLETLKNVLSHFDFEYYSNPAQFKSYLNYLPEIDSFKKAAENRSRYPVNRQVLHQIILEGYGESSVEISPEVMKNIELLSDRKTFTVATAHQPCLLGGPFYFFLKIASVISLANALNKKYGEMFNVVPVFIIGGEDHDFEEVSKVSINNTEIVWKHTDIGGPVGRMNHQGTYEVLAQLKSLVGDSEEGRKIFDVFRRSYENTATFAQATLYWVNEIFSDYGLVIVNMDRKLAKDQFIEVMKQEIQTSVSEKLVNDVQQKLNQEGFKSQAFAREINLYKIENKKRKRIIGDGNEVFWIEGNSMRLTRDEVIKDIEENSQDYSPNVVLRPVFQEIILPNLAYLGGGGELAYWVERKAQFDHFGIHYPILIRRDSLSWLDKTVLKKIKELNIDVSQFFMSRDIIIREFLSSGDKVSLYAEEEKKKIAEYLELICIKAEKKDPTVASALRAESRRIAKQVDQMENRLFRAEKQREDIAVNRIDYIKEKLFPTGKLQERNDAFIPLFIKTKGMLADILIKNINPMDRRWNLLLEND